MAEKLFNEIGSITPDNLIVGDKIPILLKGVTLSANQGILLRGSMIGIVTASGKGKLCDSTSSDGSQIADAILTDDVDTTDADAVAQCYQSGMFNRQALIFGGNDTASQHEAKLREKGIFLKDNIEY